jgi:hypothetical protein
MAAGNEVTLPDIMAANGVIHGIDGVITDLTGGHSVPGDMGHKDDMGRGLHWFTSQFNLSVDYGTGGARRGCVAHVKRIFGGV